MTVKAPSKQNTVVLFIEASNIIKNRMQQALPLPFSQCQTLSFIAREDNPSMQEVARYFNIRAPSATLQVDELVRGGYVVRSMVARDRRKIELALTPKGNRAAAEIEKRRAKVLGSVFGTLGMQDRRHLERILKIIISNA